MNKKTYLEKYQKIVDLIEAEFPETGECKVILNTQYSHDRHDCTPMKEYTDQRFEIRVVGEVDTKEDGFKPTLKTNVTHEEFINLLNKHGIKPTFKMHYGGYNNKRNGVIGYFYTNGNNIEMWVYPDIFGEIDSVTIYTNTAGYQPMGRILQSNDVEFSIMNLIRSQNKYSGKTSLTEAELHVRRQIIPYLKRNRDLINLKEFVNKLISILKEREISTKELQDIIDIYFIQLSVTDHQESLYYKVAFKQILEAHPDPYTFASILSTYCIDQIIDKDNEK